MFTHMISKISSRTEISIIPSRTLGGINFDKSIPFGLEGNLASIAAIPTDRVRPFEHPGAKFIHGKPTGNGTDRANLDTPSTKLAIQFMRTKGFYFRQRAPTHRRQGFHIHD